MLRWTCWRILVSYLSLSVYTTTAILCEKWKRMHSSGLQHTWYREYHYLVGSWPCGWPILHVCAHKVSNLCNTMIVLLYFLKFGTLVLHTCSRYWFHSKPLRELYGRIVNLEFESLGMSVTEMYHFWSWPQTQAIEIVAVLRRPQKFCY